MWERHFRLSKQYPKISLQEERRLIAKAKRGSSKAAEELVLRHTGFVIFRINKRVFPSYLCRFGEELFSEAILVDLPLINQTFLKSGLGWLNQHYAQLAVGKTPIF